MEQGIENRSLRIVLLTREYPGGGSKNVLLGRMLFWKVVSAILPHSRKARTEMYFLNIWLQS